MSLSQVCDTQQDGKNKLSRLGNDSGRNKIQNQRSTANVLRLLVVWLASRVDFPTATCLLYWIRKLRPARPLEHTIRARRTTRTLWIGAFYESGWIKRRVQRHGWRSDVEFEWKQEFRVGIVLSGLFDQVNSRKRQRIDDLLFTAHVPTWDSQVLFCYLNH